MLANRWCVYLSNNINNKVIFEFVKEQYKYVQCCLFKVYYIRNSLVM